MLNLQKQVDEMEQQERLPRDFVSMMITRTMRSITVLSKSLLLKMMMKKKNKVKMKVKKKFIMRKVKVKEV